MKYLRAALVVIWRIWFYILAFFCTIFLGGSIYILTYQKNDRLPYFFMRVWSYVLFYGMGFTYSLNGSEKLDLEENYILVSNHTSIMDIALMFILHPKHPIVFVGKKELEKYPIFGRIYRKVSILVDRSDKKSREAVFPEVKKALKERNKNVVLFAEGGVPDRDIVLNNFKAGPFVSSIYCDTPIVVYAFHNLKNMFPFVFTLGYPGRVKVERLAVLYPDGETKDTLKEKAFSIIYERVKEDKIEHPEIK